MRRLFFLLLIVSMAATAQTTIPFSMRVQQGTDVTTLPPEGTITFAAASVGVPTSAIVNITYKGTGTATATIGSMDFAGSTDYAIAGLPEFPIGFTAGQTVSFTITYKPTTAARQTARVGFNYTEASRSGSFGINLAGTAPDLVVSYVPQGGNTIPLNAGDTIAFPATPVNESSTNQVSITNRGSGSGVVNAISSTGAVFTLAGLPLPPATVEAGKVLTFSVKYSPLELGTASGSLRIDLVNRSLVFNLAGSSTSPVYAYDAMRGSEVSAVTPGQILTLPDTSIGDKTQVVIRVRNTGNADGRILAIAVSGTGYQLTDSPFLPLVLPPGGQALVTVTFTPTQPGRAQGGVKIGADSFELVSNGLGAQVVYSYIAAGVTTTISSNGTVVFPAAAVGDTSAATFVVTNNGTSATALSSISVATTGTVFALSGVPALPASVAPGASVSFTVAFAPTATGASTGTLKIDTLSFALSGVGNPPPPLPAYSFSGASGAQEPFQQVAVGLSLASKYPIAVSGTLTLAFNSDVYASDPAVLFATGGKTVNFTIPAGSTQAVFQNNSTQIRLQTGTVAGTIVLTPSFATDGGINLTPTNPPALNLTVAQSAPRLLSVQLSAKTTTSIILLVTGYATNRSITSMDFQFNPVSGENLSTTKLTLAVEPSFNAWYLSTASAAYGSQFTVTVPFTLAGDVKAVTSVAEAIQSISVTLSNRLGVSSSQTLTLK